MAQLFLVMVSISLLAILLVAGANYVQPSANVRIDMRDKTVVALQSLSGAYRAYKTSNRAPPPVASWESVLVPHYTEKWSSSRLSHGGLSYAKDATHGHYFCYTGSAVTSVEHDGLLEVPDQFPSDTGGVPEQKIVVISYNACGKRSDDVLGATPASWPAVVYVTYWLDEDGAI